MRILALGDIHAPWGHEKAIAWAVSRAREFKPTHIIQVGDAADCYAQSRFPKVLKMSAEQELTEARAQLVFMWDALKKVAPQAKKFQLVGNHEDRIIKRVTEAAPELASLVGKSYREFVTFDRVTTIYDPKEELFIGDICFQHGYYSNIGEHARFNQCNTVHGHTHRGGTWFGRNRNGVLWELDCGLLGDPNSAVFGYRAQKKIHSCTLGIGLITDAGPTFEPFKE